jgi:hypothetical protein
MSGQDVRRRSLLFDAHAHFVQDLTASAVGDAVDAAGVRSIVIFGYGDDATDAYALALATQCSAIIPGIGLQKAMWERQDPRWLGALEQEIGSGRYRALGEAVLRLEWAPGRVDYEVSPTSPFIARVLAAASDVQLPITIHHDEAAGSDDFARMLEANPRSQVVWAHWGGRSTPERLEWYFSRFPNVLIDLARATPHTPYGVEKSPLLKPDGRFAPGYVDILHRHSARVLAASDAVRTSDYADYGAWWTHLRKALGELDPVTRQRIAFENAAGLYLR